MNIDGPRWLLMLVPRSGWWALAILAAGTISFEVYTTPWSHTAISTPYTMAYGIATVILCLYGARYGIAGSLLWYGGVIAWQYLHNHKKPLMDADQGVRFGMQILIPWIFSSVVAGKRRAEQKIAQVLDVMAQGYPHALNNQIMIIQCGAKMLEDRVFLDATPTLIDIQIAANRMERTVRSMSAHARQGKLAPELVDTTAMLRAIEEAAR